MNLRLSKLPSTKVLLKLEFDTEDQVLFEVPNCLSFFISIVWKPLCLKCILEGRPYFINTPVSWDFLLVFHGMKKLKP